MTISCRSTVASGSGSESACINPPLIKRVLVTVVDGGALSLRTADARGIACVAAARGTACVAAAGGFDLLASAVRTGDVSNDFVGAGAGRGGAAGGAADRSG